MSENHGIKIEYMDPKANPGVDFFRYANGQYVDTAKLPQGYPRWGTFLELRELSITRVREILEQASADTTAVKGSIQQRIGDFYASGMDTKAVEAEGSKALDAEFAAIKKIRTRAAVAKNVARLHALGVSAFFGFGSSQSFQDSSKMIAVAVQSGLSMGRDYYVDVDDASIEKRRLFVEHISRMLQLIGDKPADAERGARTILAIETALAFGSMEKSEMRDPKNIDHVMGVSDLAKLTPAFDFKSYFTKIGAPKFTTLNVMQPNFFKALNVVLTKASLKSVRTYLRWKLITSMAPYLSTAFVDEDFSFFNKVLTGVKEQQPRNKVVIDTVNGALGEDIGQLYAQKYFPPEAKDKVLSMIQDGKAEMRKSLESASFLDESTRKNLLDKLDKTVWKIGYPDKFADYSSLVVERGSYVRNVMRANELAHKRDLEKIGQPQDKTEWYMTPQTVNAYANPPSNEVVFPAAILQPPFFDAEADDAVNYGGILVVILHEFGHLFDDSGANYDSLGNVNMQWSDKPFAEFMKRVQLIKNQFGKFTVGENKVALKGDLVSGEAAADLNGVNLSYRALQRRLARNRSQDD